MDKRLNITISFAKNEEIYYHVKNQPNSSYYIRKLVKDDIRNTKNKKNNSDIEDVKEIAVNIIDW